MLPYVFTAFRRDRELPDFTDPYEHGEVIDKSTIRRGWLLVLVIMLIFVGLAKLFPNDAPPTPAQPAALTTAEQPHH